jgi:hypothetical protein
MELEDYCSEASENYCFETSEDFSRIYRFFKNNDSSNIKLKFGTDDTGIIEIPEKETVEPIIKKYPSLKEEAIYSSLKPQVEIDLNKYSISSSIEPEKIVLDSPYIDIIPLEFSNEVENLIIRDSTFRKFINEIERSLNKFLEFENVRLENKIFFEEDWELPNYKKLVLNLNFKDILFKQQMSLWKVINTITYNRIKSMILYSSEQQVRRIKKLKKNFFIKLEI